MNYKHSQQYKRSYARYVKVMSKLMNRHPHLYMKLIKRKSQKNLNQNEVDKLVKMLQEVANESVNHQNAQKVQ